MNRDAVRDLVELVAGSGIAAVLSLLYLMYAGRMLGPAEYAEVSAALAVLYCFGMAVTPLMPTISRFVAGFALRNDQASIAGLHRAVSSRLTRWVLIVSPAALLLAMPIRKALRFQSLSTLVLTMVCIVFFLLVSTDRGVLQGLARFRVYNLSNAGESAIRLAAGIAILSWRPTAPLALVAYAAALIVSTVLLRRTLTRWWRQVTPAPVDLSAVVRFAGPMLLVMIAFAVQQNADVLAAKRWLDAESAGWYGAASSLTRVFAVITAPFFVLLVPRVTALQERRQPITGLVLRLIAAFLGLSSIPLALMVAFPLFIMRVSYGIAFSGGAAVLVLLASLAVVTNTVLLIAQSLVTAGRSAAAYLYVAGAVTEVIVLALRHDSPSDIVTGVIVVQVLTLACMVGTLLLTDRLTGATRVLS